MRFFVGIVLALVVALAVAACGADEEEGDETAGGAAKTTEIVGTEFKLEPSSVQLDAPGTYTFRLVNEGSIGHALEVESEEFAIEEETEVIGAGETVELTVELTEAGSYELYCPVDGHREKGMEGEIVVGSAAGAGGATTGTTTQQVGGGGYGGG